MSSTLVLFAAALGGTVVGLHVLLTPRAFNIAIRGIGTGIVFGSAVAYINSIRKHSLPAVYVPIGLSTPKPRYSVMRDKIFSHITQEYDDLGQIQRGEESITVEPNVFAQIGVIDEDGVRKMWSTAVLPTLRDMKRELLTSNDTAWSEIEKDTIFCDIGSGVGNVCIQLLAETNCKKTVGIEVIPSRIKASQEAFQNAVREYPEIFENKSAVWYKEDLVDCEEHLRKEGVNVVFTHSWMFDDSVMEKLSSILANVPTLKCVISSRKLSESALKGRMKFVSLTHFSADWNTEAPFYLYAKVHE